MKLYPKGRKTYPKGIKYEGRKTYPIYRVYYSYPKGWTYGRPLKVGKPTPIFRSVESSTQMDRRQRRHVLRT